MASIVFQLHSMHGEGCKLSVLHLAINKKGIISVKYIPNFVFQSSLRRNYNVEALTYKNYLIGYMPDTSFITILTEMQNE